MSRTGVLVTALFSLVALTVGILSDLGLAWSPLDTLVLFGAYCIGLGWLTYIHPPIAERLGAWALAPGMVGEGVLTLWLLIVGVDSGRWRAQGG